jgi:putative Mn2+ efflux pump MntP
MSAHAHRLDASAVALTLLSGAAMMAAGYVGGTESWIAAGLIAVFGGLVIFAALALTRRADQTDSRSRSHRGSRVLTAAATLLSGGVMVLAGYAASAWGWGLAALLATTGGLVIAAARRGL